MKKWMIGIVVGVLVLVTAFLVYWYAPLKLYTLTAPVSNQKVVSIKYPVRFGEATSGAPGTFLVPNLLDVEQGTVSTENATTITSIDQWNKDQQWLVSQNIDPAMRQFDPAYTTRQVGKYTIYYPAEWNKNGQSTASNFSQTGLIFSSNGWMTISYDKQNEFVVDLAIRTIEF